MACNIEVYLMEQLLLFSYIKGSTTQFLPTMIYGDVIILHNEGLDKGGLYVTLCSSFEREMVLSFTPARESQRLTSFYRELKFVFFLLRREGYPLFA